MITFAGKSLADYGVNVFRVDTDSATARELEVFQIPGRSGDMLVDMKRYPNRPVTYYLLWAGTGAEENCVNAKNYFLSFVGYQRLEDTDFPDEYRLARVSESIEPVITRDRDMFKFQLELDCKPQRFLLSGEQVTTLTASGSIENPTRFNSRPLLRVYGSGILGIGAESITISDADVYTDIDCEMMDAYKGTVSKNANIRLSDHNFPEFAPGINNISLGSGITRVEITPRWWKL